MTIKGYSDFKKGTYPQHLYTYQQNLFTFLPKLCTEKLSYPQDFQGHDPKIFLKFDDLTFF